MVTPATAVDYASALTAAIVDIFATMIPLELAVEPPLTEGFVELPSHVTAMLGLTGDLAGLLAIHCTCESGCAITGAFLGMEVAEIDADVKDAIGELANMVAGGLKVALADAGIGIGIELAIPSVISGKAFQISAPSGTRRLVIPLRLPDSPFWIELKIRGMA